MLYLLSLIAALAWQAAANDPFFPPNQCDWSKDPASKLCREASTEALVKMGNLMHQPHSPDCTLHKYGERAAHFLCNRRPSSNCTFYSFGVNKDWTFDKHIAEAWKCDGILLDPSINHPSHLHPRLKFLPLGATMLQKDDMGGAGSLQSAGIAVDSWLTVSPVKLMQFLGHKELAVLKMDCEGCEYAIAKDLFLHGDPRFFSRVEQFAFEAHVSKAWTKTSDHIHYLGLLYHILFREGFHMERRAALPCSGEDEILGCMDELLQAKYPCGRGRMCQEFTFSRIFA